jgi:hypothetical protein
MLIKTLLTKLIENESQSEVWRSKLNNMPMFNTRTLFQSIIKFNDENILLSDIEYYFQKTEMSDDELMIILSIFDNNRDNKISYHEVYLV